MDFKFEVQIPEDDIVFVPSPQMLIATTKKGHLKVTIYFMENTAFEIAGGLAKTAMGKVKLQYTTSSPNGAIAASVTLRKIVYLFQNPQGIASNFVFIGHKI